MDLNEYGFDIIGFRDSDWGNEDEKSIIVKSPYRETIFKLADALNKAYNSMKIAFAPEFYEDSHGDQRWFIHMSRKDVAMIFWKFLGGDSD